ncbi:hypothetical protein EDD18DRAFT_1389556 [Armillaria luteobubalina]|uniref:Uncharacterized protein n=1 Tax=Armillaria luteobubalina TaxID=153913 RepID=A0AA39P0Q6_9AGAR|nr:hypothetical protein EDD18DRAFT_1389556 [Armillaria luteobubalina]
MYHLPASGVETQETGRDRIDGTSSNVFESEFLRSKPCGERIHALEWATTSQKISSYSDRLSPFNLCVNDSYDPGMHSFAFRSCWNGAQLESQALKLAAFKLKIFGRQAPRRATSWILLEYDVTTVEGKKLSTTQDILEEMGASNWRLYTREGNFALRTGCTSTVYYL